jgi:hypothetical protein
MQNHPIVGNKIRWTFIDGPLAQKTFEHEFHRDGSVSYRMINGKKDAKATEVDNCQVVPVGEDVYAVSYLGSEGYTLTVVLDYRSHELVAFASNEESVQVQHGTFESSN